MDIPKATFILSVWIDSCGIEFEMEFMQANEGGECRSFKRDYSPKQVDAINESFRQGLLEFIDDFRKKR